MTDSPEERAAKRQRIAQSLKGEGERSGLSAIVFLVNLAPSTIEEVHKLEALGQALARRFNENPTDVKIGRTVVLSWDPADAAGSADVIAQLTQVVQQPNATLTPVSEPGRVVEVRSQQEAAERLGINPMGARRGRSTPT